MLKQPATYAEQMAKLREHGCVISDEAFCEEVLSHISYYRLSAYFFTFKTADGKYMLGADFNKIYKLYEFDRKLRRLLFSVIDEIEVFLQARLSYYHSHKYGADGYMNAANFNSRHNSFKFIARINDLVQNNEKLLFIKHHTDKYGGQFPLWVISELFTFGMLSYFYADMLTADQKYIAHNSFNTTVPNLKSWLYCCTNLRNTCAHSRRLYNNISTVIPANVPNVDKQSERKLFASIMTLRALYPYDGKWNDESMPALSALMEEYESVIELSHIGFPKSWESVMWK